MTTELDFHNILDSQQDNWQTRLVFADFLEERNDRRALGYRALGRGQYRPRLMLTGKWTWWNKELGAEPTGPDDLPSDWINKFADLVGKENHEVIALMDDNVHFVRFKSRSKAENMAAKAFLLLPYERQLELLKD